MAVVRSTWTSVPIPVDGMLPAAEWSGAGTMPIPDGFFMAKNDANNLFIALDLPNDQGNDAGTADYYWLVLDLDNNAAITPLRDVMYSAWPGQPNRIGRWPFLGPYTTQPAPNDQVLASTNRIGFGPSLNSAVNHRRWEIRLSLAELGITLVPGGVPPVIGFGLRVASSNPAFVHETPLHPDGDFSALHRLFLAAQPESTPLPGGPGVVIACVGIIPATKIAADGYATITEPYYVQPDEAAFTGTLNLTFNRPNITALYAGGARKYRVMHRYGNTAAEVNAAAWAPIRRSWSNYRWTGTTFIWESFGPDTGDMYTLVDPAVDYSIKDLLFQWETSTEPNNLHQVRVEFFDAANHPMPAPAQVMTLRLDNRLPNVELVDIKHNGVSVQACAIETMTSPADGVQLSFTAFDPEGDLWAWALTAEWGAGHSETIASDSYANPANRTPTHNWQGVTNLTRPTPPAEWAPPVTCAYLFRIAATARATNGYTFPVGWVSNWRTVTLIKPGIHVIVPPPVARGEVRPFGMS